MNKANYNYLLIFCFCMLLFTTAKAQPTIQWEKSYGGTNFEQANSVLQTLDGGFVIAGFTFSVDGDVSINNGGSEGWIIKIDATGVIQWEKSYGASLSDYIYTIQQTSDNGFIFSGIKNSTVFPGTNNSADYWIVKLDSIGNVMWDITLGGSQRDAIPFVRQTSDGGFIVSGTSNSLDGDVSTNQGDFDVWIVKLDTLGIIEWEKSYGGSGKDIAYSILQTYDDGYIVASSSNSTDGDVTGNKGDFDVWIIKLGSNGSIEWEKSYGGTSIDQISLFPNTEIAIEAIQQTPDSGFVFAALTTSNDGDVTTQLGGGDYWIVKIDKFGNIIWEKSFGGSSIDVPFSIQLTNDNGFFISGFSESYNSLNVSDFFILKINSNGNSEWQKIIGGSNGDIAYSSKQTSDGGFIIAGSTLSSDGDVSLNKGWGDFWVVKLSATVEVDEKENTSSIIIFPNPTNGIFTISSTEEINEVEVFNALGKAVYSKKVTSKNITVDLTPFPKGIYLVQLKTNTNSVTKKIVYE
ncbi:MAG: hypothetical protein CVT95_04550 [Bacteroidetes bacterium HGW-Bacteroidetes-12]|nr:MAG: hypothetical protein CVT95_04550 [Bacteroidetes bacterium HGW-Bacteroidetes-12]